MKIGKVGPLLVALVMATAISPAGVTNAAGPEPPSTDRAQGLLYSLTTGLLAHDIDGLWSGSRKEGGVDVSIEATLNIPARALLAGIVRVNTGLTLNDRGDTSTVYAGLLWEREIGSELFLTIGVGLAAHDGALEAGDNSKKALGSSLLFRVPLELGYTAYDRHRFSVAFAHISNAYLASPNEGLDTVGLRYTYLF